MNRVRGSVLLGTVGLLTLIAAGAANAAPAPVNKESEGQAAENVTTIDDVIVTAQRRKEPLQNVPLAITAMSSEQLEKSGVHNLEDISGRSPGVFFKNVNIAMPNVAIRGIGTTQLDNSAEAPVGLFVDDVYLASFSAGLSSLYDIDRIEILRGPQGTLYGRNTIGGAINVLTRDPTQDVNGQVEVEFGSFGAFRTRGAVGGALTSTLSGRVAFATNNREGWTRDPLTGMRGNNENNVAGRGKLLFQPNERAKFKLSLDYSRDNNADSLQEIKGTIALGPLAPPQSELTPNQPYVSQSNVAGYQRRIIWSTSLKSEIELSDSVSLTSITAFQHHSFDGLRDFDAGPAPLIVGKEDESGHQFSQEVRLASTDDSPFKWLVGAYYFSEKSKRTDRWTLGGLFPQFAAFTGDYIWSFNAGAESYAAFGQASYAFTDKLEAVLGLRYSHDMKDGGYNVHTTAIAALPSFISPTAGFSLPVSHTWSSFDPAITLNYRPTETLLIYGSYKTGFKSGGFQFRPVSALAGSKPYNPEHLRAYELGLKSTWLDRRLIANLSAFTYDYQDLQQLSLIPGTAIAVTTNVGRARVNGAELELVARPTHGLNLSLNYAYLDARIRDYVDGGGIQRAGNYLNRAPKGTLNVAAEYTADLTDLGDLSFRVEYLWKDTIFFDANNAPVNRQGPVGLLNARVTFATLNSGVTVSLLGSNLTKEVYCENQATSTPATAAARCYVGAPRQFALNLKYRF